MSDSVKRLAILGSTGSIGQQTLDIVRALPDRFRVIGLAAGKNIALLAEQINEVRPEFVNYASGNREYREIPAELASSACQFISLEDMACHVQVDVVVIATSGKIGLAPTLSAVKAGKNVALANKESLVMAGEIITKEAALSGARVLPVDSEHSAIWQCLDGEKQKASRIILTASGGPFFRFSPAQLAEVTVEQALKHPSWRMGRKVTIDSATLMNKGLEVIEAHWLFHMPVDSVSVLVHPQSIIHSMVEFVDGSIKAQLSYPDMRLPIQYALSYPERWPNPRLPRVDWNKINRLTFQPPDFTAFPCLGLALEAGGKGGTCPAVLCAADEVAVELFLSRHIGFADIAEFVGQVLAQHRAIANPTLAEILAADVWAREKMLKIADGDS
ncbi:MAG: 1-deoxy-D-xylulose-5-phosphate reductoisomerase [Dehalococcoidales bacterium]|jgi:1-deoxy-D-xylulose-5-phosphate reductoisomerase|nr:1-deoxy-D-xylulose-5-phosphate reductoisomerase [Dehalococcoidales bacterium]MDP7285885.1 1-deoxy-D-xylulose-5-phosphate reductoisomerase [Dehalococcoidales bacterium]MDP7415531.1 1-deoxy-D-xylulose-5-phosphate reductoisomerase [Dehalococcoidales bacterium]